MLSNIKEVYTVETINLDRLSFQVSQMLAQYPNEMLQYSGAEIATYIKTGLGVVLSHPLDPSEMAAFAKLYQWPGINQFGQVVYEFGSWIVPNKYRGQGYGYQAMYQTVARAKELEPNCQVIGVAEIHNHQSFQMMVEAGGTLLLPDEWPSNFQIRLQNGQAQLNIVDITHISQESNEN